MKIDPPTDAAPATTAAAPMPGTAQDASAGDRDPPSTAMPAAVEDHDGQATSMWTASAPLFLPVIEEQLRTGSIVDTFALAKTGTAHKPQGVVLDNGLKAVVKLSLIHEEKGPILVRNEAAAYELDKAMGLGMVPPTVLLHSDEHGGYDYSMQFWIGGGDDDGDLRLVDRDLIRRAAAFELLLEPVDRGGHNWIVLPDRRPVRVVLIDNGACFDWEPPGPVDPADWTRGQIRSGILELAEEYGGPDPEVARPLLLPGALQAVAELLSKRQFEGLVARLEKLLH